MYTSSAYIIGFAIFVTFYFTGGQITLPLVFQTISLLFAIRLEVVFMLPMSIHTINEIKVGCKRIQVIHHFFLFSQSAKSLKSNTGEGSFYWIGIRYAMPYCQKYTPPHCFFCNFAGWVILIYRLTSWLNAFSNTEIFSSSLTICFYYLTCYQQGSCDEDSYHILKLSSFRSVY